MNRCITALTVLLIISGCSQDVSPVATLPPDDTPESSIEPAEAENDTFNCANTIYAPYPPGMKLHARFIVRSDRVFLNQKGRERRRTALELLDGDAIQVAENAVSQLVAAGLKSKGAKQDAKGMTAYSLRKPDYWVSVRVGTDVGARPAHPRSVGLVIFEWPAHAEQPGEGRSSQ